MPRPKCSVCEHPRRSYIERAWIEKEGSRREIAARFDVSYRQLNHHFDRGHVERDVMAARVAKAADKDFKKSAKAGSRILGELEAYRQTIDRALKRTDEILGNVNFKKDPAVQLAALREQMAQIREATRLLELEGKLTGELDQTRFSLLVLPQWMEIRDIIFGVLERYPEARLALLDTLTLKLADRAQQALPAPRGPEPDEDSAAIETEGEVVGEEGVS